MIVTTTPSVEGKKILEYKGIVFGEVISGVDFIKDFTAGLSNFFGGRSGTYEEELIHARPAQMDMAPTGLYLHSDPPDHRFGQTFYLMCVHTSPPSA